MWNVAVGNILFRYIVLERKREDWTEMLIEGVLSLRQTCKTGT